MATSRYFEVPRSERGSRETRQLRRARGLSALHRNRRGQRAVEADDHPAPRTGTTWVWPIAARDAARHRESAAGAVAATAGRRPCEATRSRAGTTRRALHPHAVCEDAESRVRRVVEVG